MSEYLNFLREQGCNVCGCDSEPHHLFAIGMGANRMKQPEWVHYSAIPMCREHHSELHQIGVVSFERKHNVNLYKDAITYMRRYFGNKI
jgi:hypothetical protein